MKETNRNKAERYFRAVYEGKTSEVEVLADVEIISSYPIFKKLFNTNSIRGLEAVKKFASGFSSRWLGTQITIHEAVVDGNSVVLIWGFQGRNESTNQQHSWGGITLFRFNAAGKIVAEIGEESEPGPIERVLIID